MTIRSLFRSGLAVAMLALSATSQAANPKPFTVPEVRDWRGAEGSLSIPDGARVTYSDPRLEDIARRFAQDYTTMTGGKLEVVPSAKPRKGDISFALKSAKKASPESYTVDITDRVSVTAPAEQGARWAASTLLQLFDQAPSLPKGRISDAPAYGFRGFQLDAGRKYIPLDYLYNLIDVMSYYKLNELNLHLNDNGFTYFYDDDWDKTQAAFRLESELFPGLTARDGSYSKDDFRDFQRYALSRGVEVIPEIDVPAHSLAFTRFRPSIGSTPEEYGKDHLNIMSEETYGFLDSLFTEYLAGPDPVFVGSRFNIGTDEYSNRDSVVVEKFRYFTDRYARFAEQHGKTPLVWGSLTHAKGQQPVKVDGLEMIVWSNGFANPQEMHDLGYKLISMPDQILYIVPHAGYYHDYLDTRDIYDTWAPHDFRGFTFEEGDPQIVGGMFAVWNDHPTNGVTVKDVHHRVMHALPTVAAKNWSGTKVTVPFDEFEAKSSLLSEAPGVNYLSTYGPEQLDILQLASVAPSSTLPVAEIGYDYTVEFDIDGAQEDKGTVLFESPNGVFWLSNPVTGTLGYSRDDKLYYLRHDVRPGEKSHVKIQGDKDALRFYLNGQLVDDMNLRWWRQNENSRKIAELRTLVFPLQKTGDYKSKISNLRVSNYLR